MIFPTVRVINIIRRIGCGDFHLNIKLLLVWGALYRLGIQYRHGSGPYLELRTVNIGAWILSGIKNRNVWMPGPATEGKSIANDSITNPDSFNSWSVGRNRSIDDGYQIIRTITTAKWWMVLNFYCILIAFSLLHRSAIEKSHLHKAASPTGVTMMPTLWRSANPLNIMENGLLTPVGPCNKSIL